MLHMHSRGVVENKLVLISSFIHYLSLLRDTFIKVHRHKIHHSLLFRTLQRYTIDYTLFSCCAGTCSSLS